MAQKSHTDFARLMQQLFQKQQVDWKSQRPSKDALRTRQALEYDGSWTFVTRKELDKLPWNDDSQSTVFQNFTYVMPLPPLEKNASFVPVMSVEYHPDMEFHRACLRIRVLMIRREADSLVGLGFRLESPERYCQNGDQEGIHDFYHAQLIKGIGYGPNLDTPDWLPCTQPSFPLWAVDPIDAVLNLVLTLYGRQYFMELLTSIVPKIGTSSEFGSLYDRLLSG